MMSFDEELRKRTEHYVQSALVGASSRMIMDDPELGRAALKLEGLALRAAADFLDRAREREAKPPVDQGNHAGNGQRFGQNGSADCAGSPSAPGRGEART